MVVAWPNPNGTYVVSQYQNPDGIDASRIFSYNTKPKSGGTCILVQGSYQHCRNEWEDSEGENYSSVLSRSMHEPAITSL